jgi:four helix bundle protein
MRLVIGVTDGFPTGNFQLPIGGAMPNARDLQNRTRQFALRVLKVFRALLESREGRVLGHQLLRSASSVAANYRAACRVRSHRDFIFKLGIVEEEADETLFWLEFIADAGLIPRGKLEDLISEAGQITAIIVASRKTAKSKNRQSEIANRKSS